MADLFSTFLETPTGASFTALHQWLVQQPEYNYLSLDLNEVTKLAAEEDYELLLDRAEDAMPDWLLSPSMHQFMAEAARRLGDEDRAQAEEYLVKACLAGLQQTGAGTEALPYLISHPADQYDLLEALGKEAESQTSLLESTPSLNLIRCTDGTELYFDISASAGPEQIASLNN